MSDEVELQIAWADVAPPSPRSTEVLDDLVGRHRQPHRRYHGLRHVVWVLRHTRRLEAAIPECAAGLPGYDAAVVTAAAWFHDAVYQPEASDNEERSALLAEVQLASVGWTPERRTVVTDLVRATAAHLDDRDVAVELARLEEQVLLDADLAVLGADPAGYAAYVSGVRGEYSHLSDADWATGRANVVERLLARRSLYRTEPGRSWWDDRARANLTAERAGLGR